MSTAYTGNKPKLTFWQIWNMCFGFFGIQFGWSLQMGNMSAVYEFLGAKPEDIPGLWLAAPMTGLLVQPIIGYLSDRTWHPKLGRRRPYFLIGAILSSLALFILPNSSTVWMAAGTLWILDSCINISMEPFRAFVGDNLNDKQMSFGYSMQSMFIGLASFISGYLPSKLVEWEWLGITREKGAGGIPQNIMWSFYIGGAVFLLSVLYTVIFSKEYPPSNENWKEDLKKEKGNGIIKEISEAIQNMPSQMKRLAIVNFLTWPGLFLMWFFYSNGVAVQIFKGDAKTSSDLFTQGIELAGKTSAILNLVTFVFSFFLPTIVGFIGKKMTHTVCLILGGLGLISVFYITNSQILFLSMGMVGIAWASILSMPYSMLAGCLPKEKMGVYMGIFNFFIVLPEILASLFFGKIMENFLDNNRLAAVMIGGFLLCAAGLACMILVKENKEEITA